MTPFLNSFHRYNLTSYPPAPLQTCQIIVGAVGGEERTRVLKIFALGFTLQRPLTCSKVPGGEQDAPVRGRQAVVIPLCQVVVVV